MLESDSSWQLGHIRLNACQGEELAQFLAAGVLGETGTEKLGEVTFARDCRSAQVIASVANRVDIKRPVVVAVLVTLGGFAAVDTEQGANWGKLTKSNGFMNRPDCSEISGSFAHLSRRLFVDRTHVLVVKSLELRHRLVRHATPALAGIDAGNGGLVDASAALDFLLRQARSKQFSDKGLSIHVPHDMANALDIQVQKPLSYAIGF